MIGLFEDSLPGAQLERDSLAKLSTDGLIDVESVDSFVELDHALRAKPYDMLTIAMHGTSADGHEYRLLLPDHPSSPSQLMSLALPPVVVLACCWSNKSGQARHSVAASVSCLAAGATSGPSRTFWMQNAAIRPQISAFCIQNATLRASGLGVLITTAVRLVDDGPGFPPEPVGLAAGTWWLLLCHCWGGVGAGQGKDRHVAVAA